MRLVYIANSFIPGRQANSIHVMKMCQAFASNGHEVILITHGSASNEEQGVDDVFEFYGIKERFQIVKVPLKEHWKGKMHILAIEQVKLAKSFKPDLVYTRCELPAFYLSFSKLPFIIEAHKPFLSQKKIMGYLLRRIFSAPNLRRFVPISEALNQMFRKSVDLKRINTVVLHDGADIPTNAPWQGNWPGHANRLQVGYFGHLYKGRGVDIILEAARQLQNIDFHVVGGRESDIEHYKNEMGDAENVYFHGFVLPGEVEAYRNQCDVLLAPYQKEVWVADKGHESSSYMSPLKIFEYMASSKCIICSDMPVLREVLNEQNAILVRPDVPADWMDAINRCRDKGYREALASAAFSDLQAEYTWKRRAEKALMGL
jgi:glycosyltransferase involved in cell wall biosynthesis